MSKALIVGASRGLGLAIVEELAGRGWDVVGTVRDPHRRSPLHDLADRSAGRVGVQPVDVTEPDELPPLHDRLAGGDPLDLLFVNAGITNRDPDVPLGAAPTADFVGVMITNVLGPLRVIEALQDLVAADGLIGAMTSGQGSITNNTAGSREVYRASKAALNQSLRSFAARQADTGRALLLMAPGWIRTALGGDQAPFTIEQNVPKIVDVMLAKHGRPGLEYLDFHGDTVPW